MAARANGSVDDPAAAAPPSIDRQVSFAPSTSQTEGADADQMSTSHRYLVRGSYERIDEADVELETEMTAAGLVEPPDGGYGWVVVAGSFLANVIVDGVNFTAGQGLQPQWEKEFDASSGATAWTVSLLTGFYLLAGPLVSALANQYGCRAVTMVGTIVACVGFTLSIFAPSLPILYLTFGVMGGIGFGLIYLPSVVIVSYYFQAHRALATGIAVCGSGIGMFVFAPMIDFLMSNFGLRGTLGVLSGITALGLLCGALFKPLRATDEQIEKVAEIAMRGQTGGVGGSLDDIPEEEEARLPTVSVTESIDGTAPTQFDKLIAPDVHLSSVAERQESHFSPHVQEGIEIERFEEQSGRGGRRKPRGLSHGTPFKSALEIRARERRQSQTLTAANPLSSEGEEAFRRFGRSISTVSATANPLLLPQDLFRMASRETLSTLNKPFSRADIFYPGSMLSLNARKKRPSDTADADIQLKIAAGTMSPRMSMIAISRLSLGPSLTAGDNWQSNMKTVLLSMVDVELLRSPSFLLLAFGGFMTMCGFFVPFIYLGRQAELVGIPKAQATFLVSILGIVNIVARICCGWLSDRPQMDALTIHNIAVTAGGLATMAVPFLDQYWMFILYCVVFGFCTACFASLRSIICVELLGLDKLTNAFGFLMMFMGAAALIGSPIAGTLYDITGDYNLSFYIMGACITISGLIGFPLKYINAWERRREEAKEVIDEEGDEEMMGKPYNTDDFYINSDEPTVEDELLRAKLDKIESDSDREEEGP